MSGGLTPREARVLAMLRDARGGLVPEAELRRALWPDGPPQEARQMLTRILHRLRLHGHVVACVPRAGFALLGGA